MKLLLDTHVLLWWLSNHTSLTTKAAAVIKDGGNDIFVSAVTGWEISIKRALGKLKAPDDLEEALETNRFNHLPISIRHGLVAGSLPRHHDDPFDRMLISQSHVEGMTLISADQIIKKYDISVIW